MPVDHLAGPHLRLDLRSSVAVAADASPAVKRRAVAALQIGGAKGRVVQAVLGVPFARLPARFAGALPRVSVSDGPGLAVSDPMAAEALERSASALGGAVDDVIWLLPPASDGPRVSALLLADDVPVGHLRITDLAPTQRPDPTQARGARTGIEWPVIRASWSQDGVVVELTDAIDVGATQPTELDDRALDELIADLQDVLGPGPDELVGAHGDLTPWNLRTAADGRRVLFDWEHRTYGPDGIDLVRFLVASPDGLERFRTLPAERRRAIGPAVDHLIALADQRDASRDTTALTEWKRADIAAERATLEAMAAAVER